MSISAVLSENERRLTNALNAEESFDIIIKHFLIGGRKSVVYFLDGFVKEDMLTKLFESFGNVKEGECPATSEAFLDSVVIFGDSRLEKSISELVTGVLCGDLCICIDGYDSAVLIDLRESIQRKMTEPDKEKVARGAKDGFVEMLLHNVSLLRRRIRDPHLITQYYRIGTVTRTDVCLCYISDRVDRKMLRILQKRLSEIKTEGLIMGQQTLCNLLLGPMRFNPFPNYISTERPDTACAQLMHGDVVLLVDNAPIATVFPVSLFDVMEDANDYYFPPITGLYLRMVRYFTGLLTTFLTPLWLLLQAHPEVLPEWLMFITIEDPVTIPVVWQLLILELAIDGLKLASLNTPSMMTTAMSVLGGVIIGDLAVKTGWFDVESLFYMGFVAMANFSMPSYELSYALKFARITMIVLTAIFDVWGFIAGFVLLCLTMLGNKTLLGYKFLYPLIPFDAKKIKKKIKKILGCSDEKKEEA